MPRVAPAIARLAALPEEERKLGPFVLTRQLGKGGFAPVWLAKEVYGGTEIRLVALKIFALDDAAGTSLSSATQTMGKARRDAIIAEARALCQVEHPNIVRFFSIASDESAGLLGLAMECVNGTPLDRKIEGAGKLDEAETLAVGCAIGSALAAVHANGLVHCDIKPANVIDALGVYKLIDFGIAAGGVTVPRRRKRGRRGGGATPEPPVIADASDAPDARDEPQIVSKPTNGLPLTVLDDLPLETVPLPSLASSRRSTLSLGLTASGTTGYMDPATLRSGAPPTPSSDLYSLGAMLFECLTGQLPAVAAARVAGTGGLKAEVLDGTEPAPPLADVAKNVSPAIAHLVDALLAPDPEKRPRSAEIVAWELERIRRDMAGRSRPLPPEELGPFRGLGRFEPSDRDVYFGRTNEIAAGLEMVRRRGVVALIGPSGSGKSSLARAGLLPAIVDGELSRWPKEWDTAVVDPGEDPRQAIGLALDAFVEGAASMEPEALAAALADSVAESGRGVLLLVDQLEELVTLSRGPSRAWAVSFLARLGAQALPGVRCIVAARRDLLDELLALPELGRVLTRATLLVTPLTDAAWEEVLDHALEVYGYALEDEAMKRALLEQLAGTSGAMPLVQFALTRLWQRRDPAKHVVPRAALDAIGGIGGALEAHADATLAAVGGEAALPAVQTLLLALTTAQGTRATRPRKDLEAKVPGPLAAKILDAFLEARLLSSEAEGLTLAHDALLTRWAILRRWIAEAREDRMHAEEIEREADAWIAHDRPPERLLKKRRLLAAEDLIQRGSLPMPARAVEFVRASRRDQLRGQLFFAAPFALVFLAGAGVLVARWDQHRLKTSLCGTTVSRRQVLECVEPIAEMRASRRSFSTRLSTRGGRVEAAELLNGMGAPASDANGYSRLAYRYDESGSVQEIDVYDKRGALRMKRMFRDGAAREDRLDAFDLPVTLAGTFASTGEVREGGAAVVEWTYDDRGFVESERYFSKFGERPRTDGQAAFGYRYTSDDDGLWLSADALGEDGQPAPTVDGFARATAKYDAHGNRTELALLDLAGKPALTTTRVSTTRFAYDDYGNETERRFYGPGNVPVTSVWGYARATTTYDSQGDPVERRYFDRAGLPAMVRAASASANTDSYGFASTVSKFDAKGNEIERAFFGADNRPIYIPSGLARIGRVYDAKGNLVELDILDADGKPTLDAEGKAAKLLAYDERGNVVEQSTLGVAREPVTPYGYARHTSKYERDRVVDDSYYGLDGKLGAEGDVARITHAYDETGNEHELVNYGWDGAPVLVAAHYAQIRRGWTDGANTETSYLGVDGKPTLVKGNFFFETQKYDDRGNTVEDAFYATDSKTPTVHWGSAKRTLEYDGRGLLVGERLYGTDGAPVLAGLDEENHTLLAAGFAHRALAYDERGNLVDERFYGVDDQPIVRRDLRYSRRTHEYDERGNETAERYFATDGVTPMRSADGTAGWHARYDDDGREVFREYLDVDGKATYLKAGYASYTVAYDRGGHETERAYFGADGAPSMAKLSDDGYAARVTTTYDGRGDALVTAYFGPDGAPSLHLGYARRARKYDERGRVVEDACLGVDGKPVLCPEGYATRTRVVDSRGKEREVALFDEGGKPMADSRGVAVEKTKYDGLGHLVEKTFLGQDGKLFAPTALGYAHLRATFDAAGNEVSRTYFGADDAPAAVEGAARLDTTWERGRPVDVRRFGPDGKPVPKASGYAHLVSKFDGGHEVAHAIFDENDAPMLDAAGWSSWTASFDPSGNETARAFFDQAKKPVVTQDGYARKSARYDDANDVIEQLWFDAQDKPVAVHGVAREVARYDEWGYEAERSFFGADGKPVANGGYARLTTARDRQGRVIEVAYFGADGARVRRLPTKNDEVDYARVTYAWDARGNLLTVSYFGADDQPMTTVRGYARWEASWDDRNYKTEERYYDTHGKPTKDQFGAPRFHLEYDAWGNVVKGTFEDADGKPIVGSEGIAWFTSEWDTHGRETRHAEFGADGQPVAEKQEGWSSWTSTFDAQGHEIAHALFGVDGKPFADPKQGLAAYTVTYDAYGNKTSFALFGADGKPVPAKGQSYAREEWKYRGVDQKTEQTYYGVDGKLTSGPDGWAEERLTYDENGRQRGVSLFGKDGKPWPTTDTRPVGWARWERDYDARGRVVVARYFDRNDQPLARCVKETWVYDEETGKPTKNICSDAAGKETDRW